MNKKGLLILLLITLFGGFLRFYKLDKYPIQLNHDEISQLYDSASIVETGKDIYGNFLPLAFPSTGDFKIGHYIYITVLPYLIFGMKEITIRIPAAFFGTLIIPAVFLFINQFTKNWKLALISSVTLAITPSEIFYSRKSFENVIGVFFIFLALFFLLRSLEKKEKKLDFLLTPLFLALPMYIYTSHTIAVPLIIMVFGTIFWRRILPQYKKYLLMTIIWGVLILPLIIITINNPSIRFRANSVSIFQDINLAKQLQLIEINNLIFLWVYKIKVVAEYSFTKYLNQFDPALVFGKGMYLTNQDMIGLGPLLLLQLPFFFLGILYILRFSFFDHWKFIFVLLFLSMVPSGLTFEAFSPHRSILAFSLMSIISSFGVFWFAQILQKISVMSMKLVIICILGFLLTINFIYSVHIYTVNFPYEKSQQIHYPYKDVALFAWANLDRFDQIIIDPIYGESAPVRAVAVHYYLAFYGHYDPVKFQRDLKMEKSGIKFDKFSVREIDWRKDQNLKNTLIIASPWSLPTSIEASKVLKTFTFYDKSMAFYAIKL